MNTKKTNIIDMHTNNLQISFVVRVLQQMIKVLYFFSFKMALNLVAKLFCKPNRTVLTKKQKQFYNDYRSSIFRIRDFKIHISKKGVGPRVILFHGWGSNASYMQNIAKKLVTEGFSVVIPDLPCHGKSSGKYINQIEMSYVIQELMLLLNGKQKIDYIVSHSWGGTATLLALDRLKFNKKLAVKKMVAISLPTKSKSIIDKFCSMLALPTVLCTGLQMRLEKMAYQDMRTLNEVYPLGLVHLFRQLPFEISLIHDQDDDVIPVNNSIDLGVKYPYAPINLTITSELGHFKILKNQEVCNQIVFGFQKEMIATA